MKTQTENLGKVSITVEKDVWTKDRGYDRLVVVNYTDSKGIAGTYLSRQPVPKNTEITDREYWIPFSSVKEDLQLNFVKFETDVNNSVSAMGATIFNAVGSQFNGSTYDSTTQTYTPKANIVVLTQAEYDKLVEANTVDEVGLYFIY
nr:MAG TPA: hypothetical protein [Crassvirales sp.]